MTLPAPPAGYRGAWRTDATTLAVYAEAAGIGREPPRAVARADDVESVQELVRWCRGHSLPLVPRGSGSGMAGGAIGDGVVIDLGRLDDIGAVDVAARQMRAGPGAIRDAVDSAARARGLRFAVDPSSGAFCTIGGMASTNAAGARSLAFGAMRESVLALDCVFADGSRAMLRRGEPWQRVPALVRLRDALPELRAMAEGAQLQRPGLRKDSSGYAVDAFLQGGDAVDLVVGSEGTLCIIVGVELALRELPAATSTILAAFRSLDSAVAAAVSARAAGATACELLDRTFLDMARTGAGAHGVPDDSEAVLLEEVEGSDDEDVAASAASTAHRFRSHGATSVATAMGPVAEAELWELRHAAGPTITRLYPALRSMQFIEDGAVPPEHFATYIRGVRESLRKHGVPGVIFGHAGNAHAHVNPLVDVSQPDWRERVEHILRDVTHLVASLGGTIAAEHGDGRLRTPLLDQVWSTAARQCFAIVKRSFDPAGMLNPGVKVPLPGQHAISAIKYDPAGAAIPERAAAVLRYVERERAYGRSRLDLIDELA